MSAFLLLPRSFDEADIEWLNARLEERLRAHVAAKYLYARVMGKDSGAGQLQPGNMVDGSSPPARQNSLSPHPAHHAPVCEWVDGDECWRCAEERVAPVDGVIVPCPECRFEQYTAYLARKLKETPAAEVKTWAAYDLTLRCCACGSTVEKYDGKAYCNSCERREAQSRGGK